ncbi:tail fiber protein [Metabacillus fastidiosus]|uniref:tail fiber protein n=1 Tax=Metabacillus fastidiosus TaxID=1458 RepID=UPI003D2D6286
MEYKFRGKYDPLQSYIKKDVVSYQTSETQPVKFYMCLTDHTTTQTPYVNRDSQYWGLLNSNSNFPESVDSFLYRANVQVTDQADINRIETLKKKSTLTVDEQNELNALMTKHRNKFILADDVNTIQDSITNVQMFFKDKVDSKLDQYSNQINVNKDNALIAIENKKKDIITYMSSTDAGSIRNDIGVMGELPTVDKTSLVNSIKEVVQTSKQYTDNQIANANTGIIKSVYYEYLLTAETEGQTTFTIPLTTFDKNNDHLQVVQNRTVLNDLEDYSVEGLVITLNEGLLLGRKLFISIKKSVMADSSGAVSGSLLLDSTVPLNKLSEGVVTKTEFNDLVSTKGQINGLATLGADGKVPQSQLNISPPSDASLTAKGVVQLNNTINSTSTTQASTPNAVKSAYDLAFTANNTANAINTKLTTDNIAIGSSSTVGNYSVSYGGSAKSTLESTAIGSGANAGDYSTAIGRSSTATSQFATAIGRISSASEYSTAIGMGSTASGNTSTAVGRGANSINANEGVLGGSGVNYTNTWKVPGSLSVAGTKNFEIPHPAPNKRDTHVIRHGAVESPTTGDTLYRYTVEAMTDGQTVQVQLPDYFQYLNKNVDVWVNGYEHFGRAFGKVIDDKLLITCEKSGIHKVLVIGTRDDDNVQDWYIKGVEREIGESWLGETYVFEVDELIEVTEFKEEL